MSFKTQQQQHETRSPGLREPGSYTAMTSSFSRRAVPTERLRWRSQTERAHGIRESRGFGHRKRADRAICAPRGVSCQAFAAPFSWPQP